MTGYGRTPTRQDTDVVGARIGAAIIDSIVSFVLVFVVMTLFLGGIGAADEAGSDGLVALGGLFGFFVVPFIIFFGYYLLLEGLWDGYTVGKKVLGIRVIKENGDPIDVTDSILRNLLRIIDGLFYYVVGFVFMATSDRKQRLGDRIASTVVVTDTPADTGEPATVDQQSPQRGSPQ